MFSVKWYTPFEIIKLPKTDQIQIEELVAEVHGVKTNLIELNRYEKGYSHRSRGLWYIVRWDMKIIGLARTFPLEGKDLLEIPYKPLTGQSIDLFVISRDYRNKSFGRILFKMIYLTHSDKLYIVDSWSEFWEKMGGLKLTEYERYGKIMTLFQFD